MKTRILVALCVVGVLVFVQIGEAHKPITSKYTYNDDVFPILQQRCARCHVAGGVAPMSLMTFEEAFPWGESIRAELVASHMPPAAPEEGFGEIKRAHALTPKEMDILLTWASGGNPRGAIEQKLPTVTLKNEWTIGKPDLALPMPSEVTLAGETMDETREFTIATGIKEARWVRGVDLLPGAPAMVRSAVIALKGSPDRVLARWVPGQDAESIDGAAFRLPAGAELTVKIRYKKTWSYEGKTLSDRSTVGLYFAPAAGSSAERELTTVAIASAPLPATKGEPFSFSRTLEQDVQAFAINPEQVPDDVSLEIEAVRPDGSRTPLVRFVTRADWTRRYWLTKPLALSKGTKIEVSGVAEDPDLTSAAFGGPSAAPRPAAPATLKLALDVVAAGAKPSAP